MNVSFGKIFKANVYLDNKKIEDEETINKITNTLARDLSCSKAPEKYGDLTHQQRIMLRMFDASYKIPEKKKTAGNDSSTVSVLTVPQVGRYMVVGKSDNDAMQTIRHDSIGVEHFHKGRSMESSYLDIFKNNALAYIRNHKNPYEMNIQAKTNAKGDMYISLIDFQKSSK